MGLLTRRDLAVGYTGDGSLTISDGGTVTNLYGGLGYSAGSSATVSVTGEGSSWSIFEDYNLDIGRLGNGTLTISDGATNIFGGTLALSGDGSLAGTATIHVASGASPSPPGAAAPSVGSQRFPNRREL